jgi:hypothetical protein
MGRMGQGDALQSVALFHKQCTFLGGCWISCRLSKNKNLVRYKRRTETLHFVKAQKGLFAGLKEIPLSAKMIGISFSLYQSLLFNCVQVSATLAFKNSHV